MAGRLIPAAWSLTLVAMVIMCKAVDISLQVGDLGREEVSSERALGVLSGLSTEQGIWWHLGSSIHEEAFLRFMIWLVPIDLGPYAYQYTLQAGDLLATRNASIAEYQSRKQNTLEWGDLDITAWMLAFHCVGDAESMPTTPNTAPACTSIAPVAIVSHNSTFDEDSTSSYTDFSTAWEFTGVWDKLLPAPNNVVANSITANLINVSKADDTVLDGASAHEWEQLRFKVLSKEVEHCPSPAMVAVRSSVDAAYNNGPYACLQISPKDSLLVLGMQEFSPSEDQSISSSSDSTNCIKHWLHNRSSSLDLGACQSSPLLAYLANDNVFVACLDPNSTTCLQLVSGEANMSCEERMNKFLTAIFNRTAEKQDFEERNVSAFNYISGGSSNFGVGTGNLCETAAGFNSMVQSGRNYSYNDNPVAVHPGVMTLLFRGLSNRYSQAHGDAFNLQRGPSTDFFTAVIALVGAAISVLSVTGPVTNSLLRLLIRASGSLQQSAKHGYRVIVLLCLLNVVGVAFLSYAAMFSLITSEKRRQEEFSTWALTAETVLVNTMGLELHALYVVQGKSVYKSKLLTLIWVLVSTVLLLVGGMTYRRCHDVLNKLQLIKQKASSPVAQVDEYKAIEMGRAEYMELLHRRQPEYAAAAGAAIQMNPLQQTPPLTQRLTSDSEQLPMQPIKNASPGLPRDDDQV